MADPTLTFAFEDDEVLAISDGVVVASGKDADEAKENANEFIKNKKEKDDEDEKKAARQSATHVVTPNGLKGKITNRTASWDTDEQVTVRFENGRIVTLATSKLPQDYFVTENARTASADSPIEALKQVFASDFEHDRDSLVARVAQLDEVIAEAREILADGASYTDERDLDEVVVHAEAEKSELAEAIEHLDAVDNELAAPYAPEVVEQGAVGTRPQDGDWLDNTLHEMRAEAEDQDFVKVLDDGPTEFATQLPDGALADQGVAAAAARDFIEAKTAGLEGEEVAKYRDVFVERVEAARRAELSTRKATARKEAAVEETPANDGPDEGLFL